MGKPSQLAGYVLDKVLGKGGMGVVYRARSKENATDSIALKVILTDSVADENVVKRVLREIGIGLDLSHKRVVRVLAHGSIGNLFYVAMELCDGGSLERLLKRHGGRLPMDKAIRLMAMCLEGLEYLHQRNLVHRDLKPANILLQKGRDGKLHPKISDFGLAKCFELAGLSGMTATGYFGGSWHYMPREQMTNFKFVGPVSDVWSFGATFYEVLTGQRAREFPPKRDPIQVVLQDDAVPIQTRDPSIPRPLAEIIDRALASDPEHRYPDAGAMRRALAQVT
jgi:serine/threonine protein kinase